MGQAKRRGTTEQRIAQALERMNALRPTNLVCGKCQATVNQFDALDSGGLPGIEAVFGGQCPQCGESVIAAKGDADAVASLFSTYADFIGAREEVMLGAQTANGQAIPCEVMSANAPEFLTYSEALAAAKQEANVEFIGMRFEAPYKYLSTYTISGDDEEPGCVNVDFNGGELFSYFGEENFYEEADVPDEAKALFYARSGDLGDGNLMLMGITSEHILFSILPGLDRSDTYCTNAEFTEKAAHAFGRFWRQA